MALHYQIVFAVMIIEMTYLLFLSLPMPKVFRRNILKMTHAMSELPQVKYVLGVGCAAVFVLFLDALNVTYKLGAEKNLNEKMTSAAQIAQASIRDRSGDSFVNAKMFYAQRNLYLTGSVLFLAVVLSRFHSLFSQLIKAQDLLESVTYENTKVRDMYSKLANESTVPELPERPKSPEETEFVSESVDKKSDIKSAIDASIDFATTQVDKMNQAYHRLVEQTTGNVGEENGSEPKKLV